MQLGNNRQPFDEGIVAEFTRIKAENTERDK